jgi:hypothetical protein
MKTQKKKESVSWFRRFFGLKDNDSRKDPTKDWFVLPPKSAWAPTGSLQTPLPQPPSSPEEEKKS